MIPPPFLFHFYLVAFSSRCWSCRFLFLIPRARKRYTGLLFFFFRFSLSLSLPLAFSHYGWRNEVASQRFGRNADGGGGGGDGSCWCPSSVMWWNIRADGGCRAGMGKAGRHSSSVQ
ncbi:uncharacterized protein J3D65DRAFT_141220 [Phyllosticta citribraziliensis]|uniref:Secreted protein n=1 Tax=Phyllosticta citribraziliensis TaxID=989973 RepID=A0ABR1LB77_9PEZI